MFYRLKEDWLLRGWEKLPSGAVKKLSRDVIFLPTDVYRLLQKAVNFTPSTLFSDKENKILQSLADAGILEYTETPTPLSTEQRYKKYSNRYLYSVHWAITGNCNCRCKHCYMSASTTKIGEPSLDECFSIIRQMKDAGVRTVSLTGGEALVRRDFFEIVDALTDAGIFITTIMSNGLLVNEKTIDELKKRNMSPEINMSFDGIGNHDWLRGIDGAEEAVIRAFRLCKENGIPTGAEYCLHKGNIAAFPDSVKLLSDLGCKSLKVNRLSLEGEGKNIAEYAIDMEEEFETYLNYLPRFYKDDIKLSLMLSGFFLSGKNKTYSIPFDKRLGEKCENYCLCGHARNYMYITAEGNMTPCIPMGSAESGRKRFPNIRDMKMTDALVDSFYMKFIDTRLIKYFERNESCASCEYKTHCAGGCRGRAVIEGQDLLSKDDDACAFFRQGWYKRLKDKLSEIGVKYTGDIAGEVNKSE